MSVTRSVFGNGVTDIATPSEEEETVIRTFILALEEEHNDSKREPPKFTATKVLQWCIEYLKATKQPIPQRFANTRKFGKLLALNAEYFGIQRCGRYGNRAQYTLASRNRRPKSTK